MTVKREGSSFLKGKNFYFFLLFGFCAVIAIGALYVTLHATKQENQLVDLNTPPKTVANQQQVQPIQQKETIENQAKDSLLENDIVSKQEEEDMRRAQTEDQETAPVMNATEKPTVFREKSGISWPVKGNVLLNYSADKPIYFATLDQYKCNPALIIGAKEGEKVSSSASGTIKSITKNEETGITVTVSLDSHYQLIYGQLKNCKFHVGDTIKEGATLANIAAPTKYYTTEGSNLYFQVLKDGKSINPISLLH